MLNPDFFPRALPPNNPAPAPSIPAPAVFPNEDLAPPVLGMRELDPKLVLDLPNPEFKLDPVLPKLFLELDPKLVLDLPNPELKLDPVLPKLFLVPKLEEDSPLPKLVPDGLGATKPPPPKLDPNVFLVPTLEPKDFGAVKPPPPIEPPAKPPNAPAPAAVLIFEPDLLGLVNPPAPKLVDVGLDPKLPKLVEAGFGAENPPIGVLVLLPEPKPWVG